MRKFLHPLVYAIIDPIVAALTLTVIWIVITGGGSYHLGSIRLSMSTVHNPLTALLIVSILRYSVFRSVPLFNIQKLGVSRLGVLADQFSTKAFGILSSIPRANANKVAIAIIATSVTLKILNIWFHYGFFNGDDVEVHIMTLSELFNMNIPIWTLRNPVFPMTFIFPAQAAIKALGVTDPFYFVATGRIVCTLISIVSCLLVYRIATQEFKAHAAGLLALFFFAFSRLHIDFSASEEPRTVSTCFVLLSALLLMQNQGRTKSVVASGISLAVGASLRFSELIFIAPAVLFLVSRKQTRDSILFLFVFIASAGAIFALSDFLYWGTPFYSLWNIVDYTLVKGLSSRGYQPFYHYLTHLDTWTNYCFFTLFLFSFKLFKSRLVLFVVIPLIILSALPHKEARYLIPLFPFVTILTGGAIWRLLENSHASPRNPSAGRLTILPSILLLFLLVGSFLYEAGGFRFRRSESAVDVARFLRQQSNVTSVAIEQPWKTGQEIYIPMSTTIEDIPPDSLFTKTGHGGTPLIESVQYIAMEQKTIERLGYEDSILRKGFMEVRFSDCTSRQGEYRLFARKPFGEKP